MIGGGVCHAGVGYPGGTSRSHPTSPGRYDPWVRVVRDCHPDVRYRRVFHRM